jgi:lipopolysaccharide export system protein LptC
MTAAAWKGGMRAQDPGFGRRDAQGGEPARARAVSNAAAFADPRRAEAFRAAVRHSRRVRWLRFGIVAAAIAGVAGLAGAFLLGGRTPPAVSLGQIGVEGSRVTMKAPRLAGFRSDSRPYEVTARAASQDVATPQLIDLEDLDARIGMGDRGAGHVTASRGRYDSGKETLRLAGDVVMRTDRGYVLRLAEADIDFKAGSLVSDKPVEAELGSSTVRADLLRIADGGRRLVFERRVRSVLKPQAAATTASPAPADSKGGLK